MPDEIGQIETARLILRPLQKSDAETLQSIGTDDVLEMVPEIKTPFDAAAWVTHKVESECPTIGHVVIEKLGHNMVGYVQITAIVEKEGPYLSAGYWFGRMYWGKGYATEALAAALTRLQSTVTKGRELIPLHAQVLSENAASRRVLEKCGFKRSDPPNGGLNTTDMAWYHWPASALRYRSGSPADGSNLK